jgi:hypothetical protein
MSTRANILLTDNDGDKLWFYQHSDGYPEGIMPDLEKFVKGLKSGAIRNNLSQAAGWLILFGAKRMAEDTKDSDYAKNTSDEIRAEPDDTDGLYGWKAGFIEPTLGMHGDINYLYVINLDSVDKTIHIVEDYNEMKKYN